MKLSEHPVAAQAEFLNHVKVNFGYRIIFIKLGYLGEVYDGTAQNDGG